MFAADGQWVSPTEDLMREHGVLDRLLLIYEAATRELSVDHPVTTYSIVYDAASIIRAFVEGYHEQLEEEFVFPRLRKAGVHIKLVKILESQHHAGQEITDRILDQASDPRPSATLLAHFMMMFSTMYRPHSAREDTVLFPAWRKLLSAGELYELGERFEQIEEKRFGEGGLEAFLDSISNMERALGIHSLAQYTPKF